MTGDGGKPNSNPHPDHPHHPHHTPHIATAETKTPIGQMLFVGGIVAVMAGGSLWWLNRAGEDNKLNTLFASNEARKISTINGQRGDITLSDGSKISIGTATKLTIIPKYNDLYRGVKVEGTAGFDVKASPNIPLEVRVGGAVFVLSEGALVVRSYDDEDGGFLKLTAGSGELRGKKMRRQLTAPAAVRIGKDSTISDADATAADVATSWVDGKVMFKGLTLKEVLPLFVKYYATKIDVKDEALLSRPVEMEATLAGKKEAIAALEQSAHVKFTYDGTTPILKDDPAAAAKALKKK